MKRIKYSLQTIVIATLLLVPLVTSAQAASNNNSGREFYNPYSPYYADMGLSVLWARYNVGASRPEEIGEHYAWGALTSFEHGQVGSPLYETGTDDITGNPRCDAARNERGGTWRMPTKEEMSELYDNCSWSEGEINGVKGYYVTSKINGAKIFFPAAGVVYGEGKKSKDGDGKEAQRLGSEGYYWCSTPNDGKEKRKAIGIWFTTTTKSGLVKVKVKGFVTSGQASRNWQMSIRPVMEL